MGEVEDQDSGEQELQGQHDDDGVDSSRKSSRVDLKADIRKLAVGDLG